MSPQGFAHSFHLARQRIVLVGMATALLAGCADADIQDLQQFVATTKASTAGNKLEPLPVIQPYRPFTYTAQGLKDPYALAAFVQQEFLIDIPPEKVKQSGGIRPDLTRKREELEKYSLGSLKMVGTLQKNGLWALIKAPDGIVHRVQTGNYMGGNHGKIINITEQRIDLTEIVAEGDARWIKRDAFLSLAE